MAEPSNSDSNTDSNTTSNSDSSSNSNSLEPIKQRFIDGTFAGTRGTDIFVYDELLRDGPLATSELADRLDIDESTARRSLRRLQSDELVESTYQGTTAVKPRYQLIENDG